MTSLHGISESEVRESFAASEILIHSIRLRLQQIRRPEGGEPALLDPVKVREARQMRTTEEELLVSAIERLNLKKRKR